jgi:hypothetical protein
LSGGVRSPWAGFVAHGTLARHLEGDNPVRIASRVVETAWGRPCLFQALVWAGFALAVGVIFSLPRLEPRLWIWSLSCATLYALYRIVPLVVWHHRAPRTELLLSTIVAAAVLLAALLLDWRSREESTAPGATRQAPLSEAYR